MVNIGDILKGIDLESLKKLKDIPESFRQELVKMSVMGEAGGGLVVVRGNGQGWLHAVEIDASLVPDEKARVVLTDLLVAAFNAMQQKVEKAIEKLKQDKLTSMLSGFTGLEG